MNKNQLNKKVKEYKDGKNLDRLVKTIKEAQTIQKRFYGNIERMSQKFPKINIPQIKIPKLDQSKNIEILPKIDIDIIRERKLWERHKETLKIQNTLLKVQNKILKQQKSTTRLTGWILFFAIVAIIIAIVSIIIATGVVSI